MRFCPLPLLALFLLLPPALLPPVSARQRTARPLDDTQDVLGANRRTPSDEAQGVLSVSRRTLRLVVILVVDQMRRDYVDQYGGTWTGGLRRIVNDGAWFNEAAYPYAATVTCAGHSTISTGAYPVTHGMVLNDWWDREKRRRVGCTEDPSASLVSHGGPPTSAPASGNSPINLRAPTLADEMRAQLKSAPRIVTLSLKERTSITLAGQRATAAIWFNAGRRSWVTSTAYTTSPVPFVEAFVHARPIEGDHGKVWTRALPAERYRFEDDAPGEGGPRGWDRVFPHVLMSAAGTPDAAFYEQWRESPFSDEYLGRLAQAAVDDLKLGQRETLDFIAVSFSALDYVGHDYGPRSHEVQDVLIRLDRTIGELLRHLDSRLGAASYVLALSADHGVAPIPDQLAAEGAGAGRVRVPQIGERVEAVLDQAFGEGTYVDNVRHSDVYLAPGVFDRVSANPALLDKVKDAIRSIDGISRVFDTGELAVRSETSDAELRAVRLSHFPGRSGDLIVVTKPYWITGAPPDPGDGADTTTHGTLHPYDARVPVAFFGAGIKSGRYDGPASPADIAPTLAMLAGIKMPRAEGRPLSAAIATSH